MSDQGEGDVKKDSPGDNKYWKRYELLRDILRSPLEMTEHEDAKAGRILASIAFLTAASATVFRTFVQNDVRCIYRFTDTIVLDLIPVLFESYLILVTFGTIFMLLAFGPFFEIPKKWGKSKSEKTLTKDQYRPKSLFFFEMVAKEKREKWTEYFKGSINEILEKACYDCAYETYLVSKKVAKKVKSIKMARTFFLLAIGYACPFHAVRLLSICKNFASTLSLRWIERIHTYSSSTEITPFGIQMLFLPMPSLGF